MKKILIVNKSFELGGIQSALNNMLDAFSGEDVQIDLMLFNDAGENRKNIPPYVKILKPGFFVRAMGMNFKDTLKTKNIFLITYKLLSTVWAKIFNNNLPIAFALTFQKKLKGYDYAVAYHHEVGPHTTVSGFVRFILKKCDAKTKISWIHSDYKATGLNTEQNRKIYKDIDKIICVSKATMNSFLESYPEYTDKCDYCYNLLPTKKIISKSNEKPDFLFKKSDGEIIFFSACRIVEEKGIERTIDAMLPLWDAGFKFKWYIAGSGVIEDDIEKKILDNNLQNKVILIGYQQNPYPYMKKSDWFLLPSYHETFSLVAAESILLGTPVLATDIPVVRELINNESGYICPNSTDGIQAALKDILVNNLTKTAHLNENILETENKLKGVFDIICK